MRIHGECCSMDLRAHSVWFCWLDLLLTPHIVVEPSGIAGGYLKAQGGGGQTPEGATHQGQKGSTLPPLEGLHTAWKAGGVEEVGFMLVSWPHVCPKLHLPRLIHAWLLYASVLTYRQGANHGGGCVLRPPTPLLHGFR